jgi:hypothetical protein
MNIDTFMRLCSFPSNTQINVYQSGSYVYGTATPSSDFDFFAVVADNFFAELHKTYQDEACTLPFAKQWNPPPSNSGIEYDENYYDGYRCLYVQEDGLPELNLNLFNMTTFKEKLRENWLQALMCVYLPPHNVLRHDLTEICAENVIIHSKNLVRSVVNEASKHFNRFKQKWYQDRRLAKKNVVYAIRGLMYGIQIARHDRIVDFCEANEFYYSLLADTIEDYTAAEDKYRPLYQQLRDEFNRLVVKERLMIADDEEYIEGSYQILRYLQKCNFNVENLKRYLSLQIKYDNTFKNLVHVRDTEDCTNAAPVVLECGNGMVIDINEQKVVSCSFRKVLEMEDKHSTKIDLSTISVYVRRSSNVSPFITMYHYDGKWRLCSENSADASDILYSRVVNDDTTISMLFWELLGFITPDDTDTDKCFVFVLDLYDRYTLAYPEKKLEHDLIDQYVNSSSPNRVYLFTVMDRVNNIELDPHKFAEKYKWDSNFVSPLQFRKPWELNNYTRAMDPTNVSCLYVRDGNGTRVSLPIPQRVSLIQLLSAYPRLPHNAQELMVDIIRSVHHHQGSLDHFSTLIDRHYEGLKPLFNQVNEKYTRLCCIIDDIYDKIDSDEQRLVIINLDSMDVSDRFSNVNAVKKLLIATIMNRKKKRFDVPIGIEIVSTDQFYAHRPTDKCCYPTLYNSLK